MVDHIVDVEVYSLTATVQFQQFDLTPPLDKHYFYQLMYTSDTTNVTVQKDVPHELGNNFTSVELTGLDSVSNYRLQVIPFRQEFELNHKEAGLPHVVVFETGRANL
jgi:hypothetical protein